MTAARAFPVPWLGGSRRLPINRSPISTSAPGGSLKKNEASTLRFGGLQPKISWFPPTDTNLPRRKAAAEEVAETTTTGQTSQMTEATTETKTAATSRKKGTPLPGNEIKAKMVEMTGQPIDLIAKACGFYTEITNNATGEVEIRVTEKDQNEFLRVSFEVQAGIKLAAPARPYRRTNRSPVVKIGKIGNIVVGGRHTSIAGFAFGEDVDSYVNIDAEPGKITITAGEKNTASQGDLDIDSDGDIDGEGDGDELNL